MPEGSQFNFWAPGQIDTSGVQQGAGLLAAGGAAMGKGIAAAGEAKGQAYVNIGKSIAAGLAAVGERKKQEQLSKDVSDYLDASTSTDGFDPVTTMDIEGTEDPQLAQFYSDFQAAEGDPDANMAQLIERAKKHFVTSYGNTEDAALLKAQAITAERTEFVMTPKQRAALMKTRASLLMRDVPAQALHSLSSARSVSGQYPDGQSQRDARRTRIQRDYGFMTPVQKSRVALRQEAAIAQQKAARVQRAEAQSQARLYELTTKPITLPDVTAPPGAPGLPTGMRQPRGQETYTLESEMGSLDQFLGRAETAGSEYPAGPIKKAMGEKRKANFIGKENAAEYRNELRKSISTEKGVTDQMVRDGVFASRQDPAFKAHVKEATRGVEQDMLPPEFAKAGLRDQFTTLQRQSYNKFKEELARSESEDLSRPNIQLGEMLSVDWEKGGGRMEIDMNQWAETTVALVDGELVFNGDNDTMPSADVAKLNNMLGSRIARGEIAMRMAVGAAHQNMNMTDINTRLTMHRALDPSGHAAMLRGESTGAAKPAGKPVAAPGAAPVDPNQTPGEQAITAELNARRAANDPSASIDSARVGPPTDQSMQADAAKRAGLPDHHGNAVARIQELEALLETIDISGDDEQRAFGEREWKKLSKMYSSGDMEGAAKQAEMLMRWAKTRKKRD